MEDKRSFFATVFTALMIFSGLVGISTVAFISSWPWEKKDPAWKPAFRIVAVCAATKEPCGIAYGDFADAKAKGLFTSLEPDQPAGDVEEAKNWLKWKKEDGIYEVKASSWHFQNTIRYKIADGAPVLLAYQDVDVPKAFTYGIAAALFMMTGLYLRKLRR